ncbi:MFS transporter [Pseudomonas sp. SK3(2021)]|uniref:MFS transporter n=1 Tax=Pseudomonas sp. SK3(2021) TaxID=2841064 RepID=UPI00192CE3A1|nr:MFS transporter [Pseudomonas sp. SK3(2021)]QQZ39503.1 MFS transporter [Pseudomonas sp. SK3(2021)]
MISISDRLSPYNDALSVASFRKLLIGQGLSMAGDAICLAALPIALIRAGFGGEVFGFVMAAVGVGTVIGAFAGGMLADRKSPKQVLIYTDTVRGIAQLAAVALIVSGAPWWGLVLAYLIFGIGIGVSRPCAQVLLVNLLPKQALVAGNGAMNFIDNLVAILFPATLGVFIILWDPVWGILIDGLTFFCAAIYTAQLPNVGHHESEEEFSIREAVNGLTVVVGNPTLLLGFAATLVVNVLCFPIFLVVAPYAISDRFSEEMWGLCLAASGFGACLGSIITVLTNGHERLIGLAVTCGLFLAGAMALLGMGSSAWMAILGATFVGIVEASWLTGWATAMQTLSPEKDLGKVVAVDTFVTSGVHPFIYLGSGIVGGIVGYSQTLTLTAIVSIVGTFLIVLTSLMFMPRSARNDQVQ